MGNEYIQRFSLDQIMKIDTKEMIFKLLKTSSDDTVAQETAKKQFLEIKLSKMNDKIII